MTNKRSVHNTSGKCPSFSQLNYQIAEIIRRAAPRDERLHDICRLLQEQVPHYQWVGFYLTAEPGKRELILGPFAGAPTEHTRIPFGQGICGQAAQRGETFVVADVAQESNYLTCSPLVKSEIVIPILKEKRVVGELDIDSHVPAAFTDRDRAFLETLCQSLAELF